MTNKEAIEVITHFDKHIIPCDEYGYRIDSDLMEAHLMAAHALSSCWIPVSERLPDVRGRYIVAANDGHAIRVSFADWQNRSCQWYLTGARSYWKVTHWMPLPESPKED